jgi:hypothetical protein
LRKLEDELNEKLREFEGQNTPKLGNLWTDFNMLTLNEKM